MAETLQHEILEFINTCKVATISCCNGSYPYSFCCFYAFGSTHLVFKSKPGSAHCRMIKANPHVSGTIISADATVPHNKGIQFTGMVIPNPMWAEACYYQRFPFAVAIHGDIYTIQIDRIKYTGTAYHKRVKLGWDMNE